MDVNKNNFKSRKFPIDSHLQHPPDIRMDKAQMWEAAQEGIKRRLRGIWDLNEGRDGKGDASLWSYDIEGCMAEYACALYLGVDPTFPSQKGTQYADLSNGDDVRYTVHPTGYLCVKSKDPPDRRIWLVKGANGVYWIIGCILAKDAKGMKECRNMRSMWGEEFHIPESKLVSKSELLCRSDDAISLPIDGAR